MTQFLVVDDYAFVREIVRQHLKSCGFDRIDFAQNGEEALQFLDLTPGGSGIASFAHMIGTRPDIAEDLSLSSTGLKRVHSHCVITDFGMPIVNGLQLVKAIRCGQTRIPRNTPVILLTGYTNDYVIAAALRLDINAFVAKPVSRNTLREKIARVLRAESPVQDIAAYEAVDIPDEAGETVSVGSEPAHPHRMPPKHKKNNVLWVPLRAVPCGAVLAADLHGARGALLLRKGSVFSEGILHKLLDVELMQGLNGNIPIEAAS
jgi:CheY-like chemotaxis protein